MSPAPTPPNDPLHAANRRASRAFSACWFGFLLYVVVMHFGWLPKDSARYVIPAFGLAFLYCVASIVRVFFAHRGAQRAGESQSGSFDKGNT
jgi:hypothetical protein